MSGNFTLTRDQVRQIDADAVSQLTIPGLLLMENAARGVCDVLLSRQPTGRVVILCGPGNNGGDGLAVTRLLSAAQVSASPEVFLLGDGRPLTADTAANLRILEHAGVAVPQPDVQSIGPALAALTPDDWIVDALLGTGVRGVIRDPYDRIISAVNASPARTLAVDLPSGMDCDTGLPGGSCVIAHDTVTFVARKAGFRNPQSASLTGRVHVRHIGLPRCWLEDWLRSHGISADPAESA